MLVWKAKRESYTGIGIYSHMDKLGGDLFFTQLTWSRRELFYQHGGQVWLDNRFKPGDYSWVALLKRQSKGNKCLEKVGRSS